MYWILMVMGFLVAVVVALIVGGLATPRKHVASRSISLRATPDSVWALIRDVDHYADWRPDIKRVERVNEPDGVLRWRELGKHGSITYQVTDDDAPRRFGSRIIDEDLPYSGEWTWALSPVADGSQLTITERGEVSNLVFRFIGAHVMGHTSTIDAYLRNLAIRLGETAQPRAAEQ